MTFSIKLTKGPILTATDAELLFNSNKSIKVWDFLFFSIFASGLWMRPKSIVLHQKYIILCKKFMKFINLKSVSCTHSFCIFAGNKNIISLLFFYIYIFEWFFFLCIDFIILKSKFRWFYCKYFYIVWYFLFLYPTPP